MKAPQTQNIETNNRPGFFRRHAAALLGIAAIFGGAGYTLNVYNEVNVSTTDPNGQEQGIIQAAQHYLGPEGDKDRCIDKRLAEISTRIAAIPDETADGLLNSGALGIQADQFNGLGAGGVTPQDLNFLLKNTPQTPDTQCGRRGGTSSNELLTKGPFGAVAATIGFFTLAFYAGRIERKKNIY